jgi:DNA gyrase subunit A
MDKFGLTQIQAQAILEMQLQRLTALERDKIDAEYLELIKRIQLYQSILASEKKVEGLIREELEALKTRYKDPRRTEIVGEVEELKIEDLIAEEDMVITISHAGYIKRLSVSAYRRQKRGGKGITGMETREEDFVELLFIASTKDYLLIFTDQGRLYWLKVYEIPLAGRSAKGKAIANLLELSSGEKITAIVPVKEFSKEYHLSMVTREGSIKKTELTVFSNPRKAGILAMGLEKADVLIRAILTQKSDEIVLATHQGKTIRFKEAQIRSMGRQAKGVRAIRLGKKDYVVGMEIVQPKLALLTVTARGFVKRTLLEQYRLQSRGGKGILNIKVTDKNGPVVGVLGVREEDEIMVVTQKGMVIRCPVREIRMCGRNAQGVRLISLEEEDRVSSVAKVVAKEEEE